MKAINVYGSKKSCSTLSGNGTVYYAMAYYFIDITVWSQKIL